MENLLNVEIIRVDKSNYHRFNDMVSWRINGVERSTEEKEEIRKTIFEDAYNQLEHEDFYVYAAEYEGRFIGWISLAYIPKIGRWHRGVIFVDELWTAPAFRRQGVAYQLMNRALELKTETGAVRLRLYTNTVPARNLYEKCGLQVSSEGAVFMEKE